MESSSFVRWEDTAEGKKFLYESDLELRRIVEDARCQVGHLRQTDTEAYFSEMRQLIDPATIKMERQKLKLQTDHILRQMVAPVPGTESK